MATLCRILMGWPFDGYSSSALPGYFAQDGESSMSLLCALGWHRRSLGAILRRGDSYVSLCERCGVPMLKKDGKWVPAEPLQPIADLKAVTDT